MIMEFKFGVLRGEAHSRLAGWELRLNGNTIEAEVDAEVNADIEFITSTPTPAPTGLPLPLHERIPLPLPLSLPLPLPCQGYLDAGSYPNCAL